MLEKELAIDYFREHGYRRYKCKKCGAYFWSKVPRDTCTEAPCGEYTFLTDPIFGKKYTVEEMREAFISFFEKRGHTRLKRYPVVARWRDDVFLVNASIYDFQPHVTSGEVPPPANPLVISQPCIRMVDVDSVGRTGRHLTGFEMMAHHAFNYPDKFIYWKDETVKYALEFIESLGGDSEGVVFKEKPWIGGGNAGASFEVIVGGLELATLVFMNLKEDPNGDIELNGTRYSEMPLKVVDTGYGLERFVWASQGTPTIYDAIYPEMIEKLMDLVGLTRGEKEDRILKSFALLSPKIEHENVDLLISEVLKHASATREEYEKFIIPLQKIYAVADYSRSLAFMLTDGIVPSNAQAGYLARLLIRRTLKLLDDLDNPISLIELVEMHINRFSDIMDTSMIPIVREMLELEEERYRKTLSKGKEIVKRLLKKKKTLDTDDLILLYDSHGLLPDIVKSVAKEMGVEIQIPENFHALVAKRHEKRETVKKKEHRVYDYPATRKLYYEDPYMREFEANVLYSKDGEVILDATAFYPEGGGQPCDTGKLVWSGGEAKVVDVQKYGEIVVHKIDGSVPESARVKGILDWERRERLMRMHTAEHVLLAAAREVLGRHVWQHGTQKDVHESRFDIAHYKPISRSEIKRIEEVAMRIITSNIEVDARFMPREEAEKKYGFVLYEGGVPPGREIRVVKIGEYDVEACGGTHVKMTGEIGFLKILRTERIQDGVSRIIYSAGISALEHVQREEDTLLKASDMLKTSWEKVPDAIEKLQSEWKKARKEVERLSKYKVESVKTELLSRAVDGKVAVLLDLSKGDMLNLSRELAKNLKEYVLINKEGFVLVYSDAGRARELIKGITEAMEGKGGGKSNFAQGVGNPRFTKQGLNKAKELLGI